jgi:hypothetical protein
MTFMLLGSALELFSRHLLQISRLQAASRHRPIAFAPEGSSLDRCLTAIISASDLSPKLTARLPIAYFSSQARLLRRRSERLG